MKLKRGATAPVMMALFVVSSVALAEGSGMSSNDSGTSSSEQSGTMGQGTTGESDTTATSRQPGMGDQHMKSEAAKMSLAPHSIAVETSLLSAIDQVKGLKAQVKVAQNQPNSEFMSQYKLHAREIKDALKSARTHENELKTRAGKFPNVSQSEQFRQLSPAISDAERLNQQWEKQSASASYWRDQNKVSSDLDQLEKRLNNALDKTKSFNSRIDVSEVG